MAGFGAQIVDRRFRGYTVWNDNGTIREYDSTNCAHCTKRIVRGSARDFDQRDRQNIAGHVFADFTNADIDDPNEILKGGRDLEGPYTYQCRYCGLDKYICRRCAREMASNGDRCIPNEERIARLERIGEKIARHMGDMMRIPAIDRDQAILLGSRLFPMNR